MRRFGLLLLVLAPAIGCTGDPYRIVPVSGTVTLNGKPLADAYITFQPMSDGTQPTQPPGSYAKTDSDGHFTLHVVGLARDGAAVAKHGVTISAPDKLAPKEEVAGRPRDRVPARYNLQSTLTFDVPAGGTANADFVLTGP